MLDADDRRLLARIAVLAATATLALLWAAASLGLAWRVLYWVAYGG